MPQEKTRRSEGAVHIMSFISFTTGSISNISYNITMNTGNGAWAISSCSLHDSVSVKYCEDNCKMKEHCQVWLSYQAKKKKTKVRVQFT